MIVDLFIIGMLIYLFIAVYATVTSKGYGAGWAIMATIISMLVSPLIVLLVCMFLLPEKDSQTQDKRK